MGSLIFIIAFSLLPAFARAETMDVSETLPTLYDPPPASSSLTLDLNILSYTSPVKENKNASFAPVLSTRWVTERKGDGFQGGVDIMGGLVTNDPSDWFADFPELYGGWKFPGTTAAVLIGRKKQEWSVSDHFWNLGLWQPRTRWDYMNSDEMGLTGVFFEHRTDRLEFTAFVSYVNLPERSPPYQMNNGEFESSNPWFPNTPKKLVVLNQGVQARYDVDLPLIADLIVHPSAGFTTRAMLFGEKGPWTRLSYAYKPMSQVLFGYNGHFQFTDDSEDVEISVTAVPRVAYHHLMALETGIQVGRWSGWVSGTHEQPGDDSRTTSGFTNQRMTSATLLSTGLDFEVRDRRSKGLRDTHLVLGALKLFDGVRPDEGPYANGRTIFESKFPYREAVRLGATTSFSGKIGRKMSSEAFVTLDPRLKGSLLSARVHFNPSEKLSFAMGADILGVAGTPGKIEDDGTGEPNFVSRYQANDRFFWGARYVF